VHRSAGVRQRGKNGFYGGGAQAAQPLDGACGVPPDGAVGAEYLLQQATRAEVTEKGHVILVDALVI
jgi:hypothetical protein